MLFLVDYENVCNNGMRGSSLLERDKMRKVIGIDLGTTNSCVSVIENGEAAIIPSSSRG